MGTLRSFARVVAARSSVVAVLVALVAALVAGPSQATTWKPAPSLKPIAGSRQAVSPGAGTVDGLPVPDAGGRPSALSAAKQRQLVTSVREAAAKGQLHESPAAEAALPGHARLVGTLPPVKKGAGPVRPTGAKPLLIPPPSAASGASPATSISTVYVSTQVDNRGGCTSFGANESSVAQSSANPNNVVVVFQMYRNPDGTCGDSHAFVAYSHDGGQHWVQTHPAVLVQPASGDTGVVFDASHNLFVMSYLEFNRSDAAQGRIAETQVQAGDSQVVQKRRVVGTGAEHGQLLIFLPKRFACRRILEIARCFGQERLQ